MFRRLALYQRIKVSIVYDCYWHLADRRVINKRNAEVEFYRRLLKGFRKGDLVFDVGANHGQKTDVFLRIGADVVAIEPDETNQEVLKQKFHRYRFVKKPVRIVSQAVSGRRSKQTMWIDKPGSAKNTLSPKWVETLRTDPLRFGTSVDFPTKQTVEAITLDDLFAKHGVPFFVKIDVEGHELDVLRGLHHPVPYLSFEVNLPEFMPEGLQCVGLLGGITQGGKFNYAVDCERGLVLDKWLGEREFLNTFTLCSESSVEVFWKTDISNT